MKSAIFQKTVFIDSLNTIFPDDCFSLLFCLVTPICNYIISIIYVLASTRTKLNLFVNEFKSKNYDIADTWVIIIIMSFNTPMFQPRPRSKKLTATRLCLKCIRICLKCSWYFSVSSGCSGRTEFSVHIPDFLWVCYVPLLGFPLKVLFYIFYFWQHKICYFCIGIPPQDLHLKQIYQKTRNVKIKKQNIKRKIKRQETFFGKTSAVPLLKNNLDQYCYKADYTCWLTRFSIDKEHARWAQKGTKIPLGN